MIFSLPDPIQEPLCPQKDRAVHDREGSQRSTLDLVALEQLVLLAGGEDAGFAFLVEEVEFAIGVQGGGGKVTAEAFAPVFLAVDGVPAGGDAGIGNEVEFPAHEKEGRGVRDALVGPPGDVGVGHVSLAVGADGEQFGAVVAGGEEDQSVAIHRARHDGVAVVADMPDHFPRGWFEGFDNITAGADDLLLTCHLDQ